MHENDLQPLYDRLCREQCSLAILRGEEILLYRERGVRDLYRLFKTEPETLRGAAVADKVVGKGAAALLILGGVRALHAGVVSEPARELLLAAGVETTYGKLVPHIVNRAKTDRCPLEKRCDGAATAAECLPRIEAFIATLHE